MYAIILFILAMFFFIKLLLAFGKLCEVFIEIMPLFIAFMMCALFGVYMISTTSDTTSMMDTVYHTYINGYVFLAKNLNSTITIAKTFFS